MCISIPRIYIIYSKVIEEEIFKRKELIRLLRAEGLSERIVRRRIAMTVLPSLVSQLASYYALMLQLQVFIEPIVGSPGLGYMLLTGIIECDIPLVVASFTLIGILSVLVVAVGYLVSGLLGPRLRNEWHES